MDGVISYLRTAAEIKSLIALGVKKVINLLSTRKIRVRLQPLLQYMLLEKKNDPVYLDRVHHHVLSWQKSRDEKQLNSAVLLYHRSGAKTLHGFRYKMICYKKKERSIYANERCTFAKKERKAWLKHIAEKYERELLEAGIKNDEIQTMLKFGKAPKGYQVHHRIPLDDDGSNDFNNLILIRDDVEHRSIHGYYNPGELRINLLSRT